MSNAHIDALVCEIDALRATLTAQDAEIARLTLAEELSIEPIDKSCTSADECGMVREAFARLRAEIARLTQTVAEMEQNIARQAGFLFDKDERIRAIKEELVQALRLNDHFREAVGECHLMISRDTPKYQIHEAWESVDLPARLQRVMDEKAQLRERCDVLEPGAQHYNRTLLRAEQAEAEIARLREALVRISHGLAAQQAMPDDWWQAELDAALALVPASTPERHGPIQLSDAQRKAIKEWAADDRLWTTQETVEANLATFARVILASTPEEG